MAVVRMYIYVLYNYYILYVYSYIGVQYFCISLNWTMCLYCVFRIVNAWSSIQLVFYIITIIIINYIQSMSGNWYY